MILQIYCISFLGSLLQLSEGGYTQYYPDLNNIHHKTLPMYYCIAFDFWQQLIINLTLDLESNTKLMASRLHSSPYPLEFPCFKEFICVIGAHHNTTHYK